jgi:hypothetical protein
MRFGFKYAAIWHHRRTVDDQPRGDRQSRPRHRPHARMKADQRSLSTASGSVSGISRPQAETAVPPQNGKRDSRLTPSPMTPRFVSVHGASSRAERKKAGVSTNNDMTETKKAERSENLNSWRREPDSNHESGRPYPFETSPKFGALGTREGSRHPPSAT